MMCRSRLPCTPPLSWTEGPWQPPVAPPAFSDHFPHAHQIIDTGMEYHPDLNIAGRRTFVSGADAGDVGNADGRGHANNVRTPNAGAASCQRCLHA